MTKLPICPYCGEQHWKVDKVNHLDCYRAYRRDYYHDVLVPRKDAPKLPEPPSGHKRCTGCKRVLKLDEFYADAGRRDGRMSRCKDCEYLRKSLKAYHRQPEQRAKRTAYMRRWRAEHRDEQRAWVSTWRKQRDAERRAEGKHPRINRTTPKRYPAKQVCKRCGGDPQSIEHFRVIDGVYRSRICKSCEAAAEREYRRKNRDAIRARRRIGKFKRVLSRKGES